MIAPGRSKLAGKLLRTLALAFSSSSSLMGRDPRTSLYSFNVSNTDSLVTSVWTEPPASIRDELRNHWTCDWYP